MIISGLQKTTLLDYPGHVAATIFLGGCNFRCPFCHNMNLVTNPLDVKISEEEALGFLKKRINVLDGVCITGGEPTLHEDLIQFVKKIKGITGNDDKHLLVKLDTNGTNPEMIKNLISEGLIDYIAMDIKTSEEEYKNVCGINNLARADEMIEDVKKSIEIIKKLKAYEFRTTVVSQYHKKETMKKIGEMIKGAKAYYIQSFIESEYVLDHSLTACEKDTLLEYESIMKQYVDEVNIRGVD